MFKMRCGIPNVYILDITMYKMHVSLCPYYTIRILISKTVTGMCEAKLASIRSQSRLPNRLHSYKGIRLKNGVHLRVASKLYRFVLYFQQVTRFHCASWKVISFAITKKWRAFRGPIFTKHATAQQHYVSICYAAFQVNQAIKVERTDWKSFTPLTTAWLPLRGFSLNSVSLDNILWWIST